MDEQKRVTVRAASEKDVPAIAAIQTDAPEASQWNPADYLAYDCRVAESGGAVVGFVVARAVASSEWEILNLAVAVTSRRQGVGRSLLGDILAQRPIEIYLEVSESNTTARSFYEALGFRLVTTRLQYYADSGEAAIVMKLYSC